MLTDQQKLDVRRYAGYPATPADVTLDDSRDFAYGWVSPGTWKTLTDLLDNLRPETEATLITQYLTPLATLESAIPAAGANLDTDQAAVWVHNKTEVAERMKLFDAWRRRMCDFIGIPPGPSLGRGGLRVSRA